MNSIKEEYATLDQIWHQQTIWSDLSLVKFVTGVVKYFPEAIKELNILSTYLSTLAIISPLQISQINDQMPCSGPLDFKSNK